MTSPSKRQIASEAHVRSFFEGHEVSSHAYERGPMPELAPNFRVLEVNPGPKLGLWSYFSNGACDLSDGACGSLEFFICSEIQSPSMVEIVTMIGYYHHTRTLGLYHTLPIGHAWVTGATCDHLLVSKPYPLGPQLEVCDRDSFHMHFLWLLPITKEEREFKAAHGIEPLELLFDEQKIRYWNPVRDSVVHAELAENGEIQLDSSQLEELDQRRAEMQGNRDVRIPWEVAKSRLLKSS